MALDLTTELVAALRSRDGAEAIAAIVRDVVGTVVRQALAERAETLEPLAAILGCSRKAAAARIARDSGLRALGVPSGKRLVFRASEVTAYLKSKHGGE